MKNVTRIYCYTCLFFLLLSSGCANRETLTTLQSGQTTPTSISNSNKNLLPTAVVDFTLSPGDVLRLEATPRKGDQTQFLIERGDSLRISFFYDGGEYRLMAGDQISISLQNDSSLNTENIIRMDGYISTPRIGETKAAGLTAVELGKVLTEKFKDKIKEAAVTVSVMQSNMAPFTLMTGEFFVLPDGTISIPILGVFEAHGLSLEALSTIISAATQKKFNNHFKVSVSAQSLAIEQLQAFDKVITVTPAGDFIIPQIGNISVKGQTLPQVREEIQQKLQSFYHNPIDISLGLVSAVNNSIYVSGEVRFPGIYPLMANMTMFKALSLSGSITTEGNLDEVVLVHYTSPESVTIYKTSMTALVDNASQLHDLPLSPQDVVFVPRTGIAEANRFINQYITRMLPFQTSVVYNFNDVVQ